MQPRGQLWFELQRVCQDFRTFSGLGAEEALRVMTAVFRNLLEDTETELAKLLTPGAAPPEGPPDPPPPA